MFGAFRAVQYVRRIAVMIYLLKDGRDGKARDKGHHSGSSSSDNLPSPI
jgi:hypothetical protein